jgi:hypothetical protein
MLRQPMSLQSLMAEGSLPIQIGSVALLLAGGDGGRCDGDRCRCRDE